VAVAVLLLLLLLDAVAAENVGWVGEGGRERSANGERFEEAALSGRRNIVTPAREVGKVGPELPPISTGTFAGREADSGRGRNEEEEEEEEEARSA
jgi:hypothetical protein